MYTAPRALEGEATPGAGVPATAQGEQPTAGAAEGQDPGPGAVAGQLCIPGHLDTLQRLAALPSLHTSPPEEGPEAEAPPSGPGLPRSVAALPGEGKRAVRTPAGLRGFRGRTTWAGGQCAPERGPQPGTSSWRYTELGLSTRKHC